ncbi:carbohydrate porin [Haloferula sp.]|uniref:carbohydrate porin n=1 Tax=Haloferula sp. TaxID=2497595 RepID=UPI003C709426
MRKVLRFFPCLAVILTAHAVEPGTQELAVNPDDIASELIARDQLAGQWSFPLFEEWTIARKKIQAETGLSWTASYYAVGLGSFLGNGVPVGASGDFTFQGIWKPGYRWVDNPTELRFRIRYRHEIGPTSAAELGPEIGALWGVVDGFSNSGLETPDFFLRHQFKDPNIELRYGQLSIDSQFGGNQLASSKQFFLNQGFASDPAVAFPRFGAGFTALLSLDNGFSAGFGASTVQGTQTGDQVSLDFGSGAFFTALQLAYDYQDHDDLARRFQWLVWQSDAVEDAGRPSGYGFSLTYEQAFSEAGEKGFARFSWSDGGAASLDYLLTAGYARPCGEKDLAGIAAGIGRGSDSEKEIQAVFEAFYRWHARDNLQITPDVQLLVGEGFTSGPGIRVVAGVRFGITF